MKKILFFVVLCASTMQLSAQSVLSGLLDKALSNETVNAVVESVTDNVISELDLPMTGTWNYSEAKVQFKGETAVAEATGSAMLTTVENSVGKIYSKLGIDQNFSFTFNSDSTFTHQIKIGSKLQAFNGTYSLDETNKIIVLNYKALGKTKFGKMSATYTNKGTTLSLLFESEQLFAMLKKIASAASSLSSTTSLASLSAMLDKYDGILLGYKLDRAN